MTTLPDREDPTIEVEALEFDGVHTDQLGDSYRVSVVSASESSVGGIDHDDRGHARWRWVTEAEQTAPTDETFDHLRALDNPMLELAAIEEAAAVPAPPKLGGGYNPYDTKPVDKKRK